LLAVDPEIENHRLQLLKDRAALVHAEGVLEKLATEAKPTRACQIAAGISGGGVSDN
jgi:hypothetical protein